MATMQDRETFGRARVSFAKEADIDEFVSLLARFESGDIGPDEWRAFRLLRGTYGQRQTGDAQMMRIKIPQGILVREQLDVLADVAERYSRGFGHITTRQNVQLHFVKLHDAEPAMRELAAAGMTTREACGNSVRNITACPYSGVADDEAFDVTPYAEALTRYLLRHPLSSVLPRKFKIAFEGCTEDHIGSAINDIGWNARVHSVDGREIRGFRVTVAGGTATMTQRRQPAARVPAGRGDVRLRGSHHPRLPSPWRLQAQAEEPAEVPRQVARLGRIPHRVRRASAPSSRRVTWRCRFDRRPSAGRGGADVAERRALSLGEIAARATTTAVIGPGIVPKVEPRLVVQSDDSRSGRVATSGRRSRTAIRSSSLPPCWAI